MACGHCFLPYPDELLTPMMTTDGYTPPICGICALALKNQIHGTHLTQFIGEQAEEMRRRAWRWRNRHPNAQPVGEKA